MTVGLLQLERARLDRPPRDQALTPGRARAPTCPSSSLAGRASISAVPAVLDERAGPHLGVDLQPYLRETGRPARLTENDGIAFIGSYVLGLGFTLDHDEAQALHR